MTLHGRVDDAREEGWRVDRYEGDRAVMTKPSWGSASGHLIVFVLLGWWTLGGANLFYALYKRLFDPRKRVVRGDGEC